MINGDVNVNDDVRLAKLSCTVNDDSPTKISGTVINDIASKTAISGVVIDPDYYAEVNTIVVLPEKIAREVLSGTATVTSSNPTSDVDRIAASEIWEYGTVYSVKIEPQEYKHDRDLISFKVGSSVLTVNKAEGTIEGTLNWADTVSSDVINSSANRFDTTKATGLFADFEISKYAMLINDSIWNESTSKFETTPNVVNFFPNGDIDGDGVVNSSVGAQTSAGYYPNRMFLFERNADYSVTVYRCDESGALDAIDSVKVLAEDRLDETVGATTSSSEWKFNLKWKDACDDADIETFSINGVSGQVDNSDSENRTITVNLPYGTPITGLVADFTTSPNAKVTLNTPDGVLVESGITSLNYTEGVLLYVTSESGENKNSYRVTVELGNHFSDIDENDWYYDNVMDAANNGYISGMGDGTFAPTQATTRAQFASMIANAMGYEADPDVASMFPDVADDFWGKAAINFCAQNGIITGYDDGTFQPNKAITRQEAASILRNAFKLTESSSETFPDDSAISGWAKESVYIVKASGLMKGDAGTGNFRPTDTIIRAEAASILMNAKYAGLIK